MELSLPGGVPARVNAAAGAGEVSLDGHDHVGVAAGSVFTTPAWAPGVAGYDVEATAGAARIIVMTEGHQPNSPPPAKHPLLARLVAKRASGDCGQPENGWPSELPVPHDSQWLAARNRERDGGRT